MTSIGTVILILAIGLVVLILWGRITGRDNCHHDARPAGTEPKKPKGGCCG